MYSEGKPLLDETFYDVKRLSYKVKDYQNVFTISEGRFKGPDKKQNKLDSKMGGVIEQEFDVEKSITDVIDIV